MSKGDELPPDEGQVALPNGCTLYWKMTEQGREYVSDEIGGGVYVWHTALCDHSTILAAVVTELALQMQESVYKGRLNKI